MVHCLSPMIRLATLDDAAGCQAIYAPIVLDSTTSYEYDPPTVEEMRRRIEAVLPNYPWLVDERGGMIAGYAYGTSFRSRAGYRWTVEVSVYVHEAHRRAGVGRGLYMELLDRLRTQGYRTAVAGISLPNPESERFHKRLGFTKVGDFHNVGYKMGQWLDSGWWELSLQELPVPPPPPRSV